MKPTGGEVFVNPGRAAFPTEQGALEGSLLGMTFLETLSHYGVTNNRLELRD